uniref:Uncharacterized protein n=1 Tax=Solanum tuberosum TaxID=4113 RepID=Q60CW3_SOLTU|nr:hypothetical protein STB1_57t00026 [Solanum tuberosum]
MKKLNEHPQLLLQLLNEITKRLQETTTGIESRQVLPHKVANNGIPRQPKTHQIRSSDALIEISSLKCDKFGHFPGLPQIQRDLN